ncbi:ABC transporter ATP-binding protein [uncultured Eubacterium sp.]|uniref:ABC transporter ATP-binding protein n=1 Tax=uncultured Eubacterium sp. TaxID=165185 RepID=UPI0025E6B39E|nr:ABC transporter ATP-binding protein [uncultured Eubacterium sp.]
MRENVKYMLTNWLKWDKRSLIYFLIRVPALVLQPIVTAYIPKAMIDCIGKGATVGRLTLVVGLLSVLVVLTTWLAPFMQELLNGSARIIRMRYAVLAFRKNLNTDYTNIENPEGREKNKRAMEFYRSYYSGSADFLDSSNQFCVCIVGVIASLMLIYKINFIMILVILATCVCEFFLLKFLNKKEKKTKDERSSVFVRFDYYYNLCRDFSAAKDIRLYGFTDYFMSAVARIIYELEAINQKFMRQNIKVGGTRALLNLLRELVAYAYLTYLVCKGKLSVSDFIFYFGIITGFSNWILNAVYQYSNLERCCNDCAAFREFVESTDESENKPNVNFDSVDSIEFKNVSFTYPSAEKSTINNMSFKVNKGENIAVVGENGAGKTTAVKLLCGLYYPTSGDILVNGKSSLDFSSDSYFNLFSAVFQDYYFMPMTIAENISTTSDYDSERLYSAFEKAGIANKINTLSDKEKSYMIKDVYKDAVDFSGGEKQKLLLAKAIYKNAPVLILDEPTAALDPIAENELYLKYNEMTNGKISFFISHRLSSTRFCDRILFIKDGKIAESGTHEELMALKGSYYRMYQVQSYYYKENGGEAV